MEYQEYINMNDKRNKGCGCAGGGPVARIVKGNDFTVVALASVYDGEKGLYVPFSLAEAADVELNIVGVYGKVPGKDVVIDGNSVSARFSGAVGVGRFGVEILFRDSGGKGRIFERNLFEVVRSSGEASSETGSEGETGEGYNISVDVRARTVRIGKTTGVTDYALLDNKPSIGGITLEGNKSLEDLDIPSKETVDISLSSKKDIYKLSREEALALVEPIEEDEGEYQRILPAALSNLVDKVIKVEYLTLEFPIISAESTDEDSALGGYTTLEATCQHLIEGDAEVYYINIIGYSFREGIKAFRRFILNVTAPTENAYSIIISPDTETPFFSVADWNITDPSKSGYIKNKPKVPTKLSDLPDDKVIIIVTGVARSNSKSATISKELFDTAYNAISTGDYKNNNIVIRFKGQSVGNYGEKYSNVLFGREQMTSGENTFTTDIVFYCLDNFNPSSADNIDSDPDWRIHLHYRRIIFRAICDDSSKNTTYSLIQEEIGNVLTDKSDLLFIPTKTGDGIKFLNDKGEYVDPVAGYLRADALETFTDASELSVTCVSGRIRQGNNIATLAIGCSASDDSQAAEERIIFSTGPSVEGITVTGVSWANGDTPSFKANKVYEISVSYIPLLGKFLATYAEY